MKIFSRTCIFLVALSLAMPVLAATDSDTKKENQNSTAKKMLPKVLCAFRLKLVKILPVV